MIKVELLQKLLNIQDEEFQKFDIEQLRLMLGVFRYLVRSAEREINRRGLTQQLDNFSSRNNLGANGEG